MSKNIGELIIYKNNQLIAFAKAPLLAVQPDKTEDKSLLDLAEIYCKSKLHLIHRLDRPASGVVLFAKNKKALAKLNEQFQERKVEKTYLAVVKEKPTSTSGELVHFLEKDAKRHKAIAHEDAIKNTKRAVLHYELLGSSDRYHLLEIKLITGRFHQIRAQLAAINNPIKGDVKYGFRRSNKDRSIHLHAWKLAFQHPVTKETVVLKTAPPDEVVWNAFKEIIDKK